MSIAANLALPSEYVFKDKEYKVHPWTFEIQGLFERHLEKCAIEAWRRVAAHLSGDEADKALASTMRDIASGFFSFGNEGARKALDAPEHVRHIFWLCLKKHDPAVHKDTVMEMFKEDYQGMIRAMNLANTDPNRRKPLETANSGGSSTGTSEAAEGSAGS